MFNLKSFLLAAICLLSLPISAGAFGSNSVSMVRSSLPSGAYQAGQVIPIEVRFTSPVTVTPYVWNSCGIASTTGCNETEEYPKLTLSLDGGTTTAIFATSSNGTSNLIFNYTVKTGDTSRSLDYASTTSLVYNSVDPSQVTIRDDAGDPVKLTLPVSGSDASLATSLIMVGVDNTPTIFDVSVVNPAGAYKAGDEILIKVFFNQNVVITPYTWRSYDPIRRPRWNSLQSDYPALALKLDNGSTRYASYVGGSGGNVISFKYVVLTGDRTDKLIYAATSSLDFVRDYLNINNPTTGAYYVEESIGSVKNENGDDVSLTLPTPGSIGSLGSSKIIKINTSSPNLVLNGEANQQMALGGTYYEAGASAYDVVDGDLTGSITRTGSVDTNKLGYYELIYRIVNSAKTETTGRRTVFVHNIVTGLPVNNTSINSASISVAGGSDYLYQLDSEDISSSRSTSGTSSVIALENLAAGEHIIRIWGKNSGEDFWQSVPFAYRWNIVPQTVVMGGGGSMSISSSDVRLLAAGGLVAETSSTSGKVLGVKVYQFKRILRLGSKGDDVKLLQFLLIKQKAGKSATALSKTGITGYFGKLTEDALKEYAKSRKLKPANGTLNKYVQGHFQQLGQDLNISMSKISSI